MSFSGSKDNIKNTFLKTLLTAGFSFVIFYYDRHSTTGKATPGVASSDNVTSDGVNNKKRILKGSDI